jgi:glycerol-3-phosphate O-acyltransferase
MTNIIERDALDALGHKPDYAERYVKELAEQLETRLNEAQACLNLASHALGKIRQHISETTR